MVVGHQVDMGADEIRGSAEAIMTPMVIALSLGDAAMLETHMLSDSPPQSPMMCLEMLDARAAVIAPDLER